MPGYPSAGHICHTRTRATSASSWLENNWVDQTSSQPWKCTEGVWSRLGTQASYPHRGCMWSVFLCAIMCFHSSAIALALHFTSPCATQHWPLTLPWLWLYCHTFHACAAVIWFWWAPSHQTLKPCLAIGLWTLAFYCACSKNNLPNIDHVNYWEMPFGTT